MKCPRCQQDNPTHARFCLGCGAHLALACGSCGAELPGGARFCVQCGQAVAAGIAAPGRSPAPETYTPKHLAAKILTSKAALEGERKQVTVLFADLKGSMELLADRDPEEARKLLDPVLELMMEAVHRYEGTVNQVMGDGVMALFGAPLAHEDHAVRACYAALRMQDSVRRYGEDVRRREGILPQIRLGLNSGDVVVRSIGNDLHLDYTAVGQTTHLAARMEQAAAPGSILVTAATLRLAEGYVEVRPLGSLAVKGLAEPVEAYEVVGAGAIRTRLQAAAARGLSRFVGRDAEVEQLRRATEQIAQGHGQVVAVVGEPGVGKSRLAYEFTHSHRTHGWVILESGSVSYGKATAYLPVIDLLRTYFRVESRDDARAVREKVAGKVLMLDRALEPALPALLGLLDVEFDDAAWLALDPTQRRQRTLDAVKRLLLRESQVQPVVLVFEDLHWIDGETQAMVDGLVESLPTAPILLLVNYRPEYEHHWGAKSYYTQLRLDPLPAASATELLDALLGSDASVGSLKRLLIERTEGNPLFLEETVSTLVETRALTGERGAHRLVGPLETVQVPATVQTVLAARIDRLPPEDKNLLQTAAVIGKDVPDALLQAVAGLPELELRERLARLQAAEFLYETRLFPDLEYTFKHALTHEVAYGSLLQERRRTLHAAIVSAIETLYAGRLAEQVERLAHHAFRGELWGQAVAYLRQAGARAAARSAYREAVAGFEQALLALANVPEDRPALELGVDLRLDLRNALFPLDEVSRITHHLQEAHAIAERLGDERRLGWVLAYTAIEQYGQGEMMRGLGFARRASAIGERGHDLGLAVVANYYLGLGHEILGDYPAALECLGRNVASIPDDRAHEQLGLPGAALVLSRGLQAIVLAETGVFAEAAILAGEAIAQATEVNHALTLSVAHTCLGWVHLRRGESREALPDLERAVDLCMTVNRRWLPRATAGLASAHALVGRVPEALALLEATGRDAVAMRGTAVRIVLGESLLLAGRTADALESGQQALELAVKRGARGQQAWALRLLGEIASAERGFDAAAAQVWYQESLALAQELGMRPLVAHCHLGLGKLFRRAGEREQAQEHLTTATTMYREMDMPYWLEKVEAE